MSQPSLKDRVILVTGGGRNIGRAIAAAAARAGAAVAVLERKEGDGREAVEGILAAGGRAAEVVADVRDPAALEAAFAATEAALGPPDGLVNNAGVYIRRPFLDTTEEEWDLAVDTNLKGSFLALQAFARVVCRHGGGGSVVNLASIHGSMGDPSVVAHCASKAGVLGLTRAAAEALRADGIRVNAVSPGGVDTWQGPWDAPPPGRPLDAMLTPGLVADVVVYLLSNAAAGITGSDLAIPGGTAPSIRIP